ncbi:MAG: phosphoribosyltransferase [Acidaminococcaceae bacterium]
MTNNQRINKLTPSDISTLKGIYNSKEWGIIDEDDPTFDRFCVMLEYFNEEERKLILKLTARFLRVGITHYYKFFKSSFDLANQYFLSCNVDDIIINPLLTNEDRIKNKVKSSNCLYYMVKPKQTALKAIYSNYNNIAFEDNIQFLDGYVECANKKILLIDDFIGTGNTVLSAVDYLISRGLNKSSLAILALVGQEDGINKIIKEGYNVFVAEVRNKAITDNKNSFTSNDLETMEKIGRKIKASKSLRFGYGESEALVQMVRTPNNTFPVYWFTKRNAFETVPFPR